MDSTLKIGNQIIGQAYPTVFLPEIGCYFQKDTEQAKETIQSLKDLGINLVKGEIAHSPEYVLNDGYMYTYQTHHGQRSRLYRNIIEELILPKAVWLDLWKFAHGLGLESVISAYDFEAMDIAVESGTSCLKIATSNIVNIPLIKYAAESNLPLIFDTGKSSISEIDIAVNCASRNGSGGFMINHSPDGHPASPKDHNLLIIESYRRIFDCPIGLADHYSGEAILYAATGLGYDLLEKPVAPDPEKADVDSPWAMSLSKVAEVKKLVSDCDLARGLTYRPKKFTPEDHPSRMGVVTKCPIKKGDKLSIENVRFAFPNKGIGVENWEYVNGATFNHALDAGMSVIWNDIQLYSKT